MRTDQAPLDWVHQDNEFPSRARMDWAHRPTVLLAARTLLQMPGPVLDIGCGNGLLLRKIHAFVPSCEPWGLDIDPTRIAHAALVHNTRPAQFMVANATTMNNIVGLPPRFSLVLLNPRRLLNMGPEAGARLRAWIRAHTEHLLIYAYGRGRTEFGNLGGFAAAVGIDVSPQDRGARAALAQRW